MWKYALTSDATPCRRPFPDFLVRVIISCVVVLIRPSPSLIESVSVLPATFGVPRSHQLRDPAQRAQRRCEAVLTAAGRDEGRQALQPPANRPRRNAEWTLPGASTHQRILFCRRRDVASVVDPLRLHELELTGQARADEHEAEPPVLAVVFEHALGKSWAVVGPAADHPVEADDAGDDGVARVHASDVRSDRALETPGIVVVIQEVVVARRIGTESRIVAIGRERERRTTPPAADELGRDQLFVLRVGGVRADVLTERRDVLMKLPEDDVGAVPA